MVYLIGIDCGTSGIKSVLVDEKGATVASANYELELSTPKPLWAEQNPDEWWKGTLETLHAVVKQSGVNPADIKGIGLSGQMHSVVLLDKNQKVLRPSILWCDNRTTPQRQWITDRVGEDNLRKWVANPPLEGFTAPKLVWVRDNEPEIYKQIHTVLIAKDYVRFKLTGELLTEVSDAAGSVMLDVRNRTWSKEFLNAIEIPTEWLPECRESTDVCGTVTQAVADATGLAAGTPVVGGGADNPCGGVGNGVVVEGRVLASLGTSGVIFAPASSVKVDPDMRVHTFCHCVPNTWYLMGVVLSAAGSFRWFRDQLGQAEIAKAKQTGDDEYNLLCAAAEKVQPGAQGLYFLPYLSGERTPHKDGQARGAFVGLTLSHTREDMIRAVIEGITFAMRDSIEIMRELGIDVTEVRATGGGAKNPFWRQLQADIYRADVVTIQATEGPALGAAILAGVGCGVYDNIPEATDQLVAVADRISPRPDVSAQYDEHYQLYRELYPALKSSYQNIAKFV
jgi:xylulokinase